MSEPVYEDEPRDGPAEWVSMSVYVGPDTHLSYRPARTDTTAGGEVLHVPPSLQIGTMGGLTLTAERAELERLYALIGRALERDAS